MVAKYTSHKLWLVQYLLGSLVSVFISIHILDSMSSLAESSMDIREFKEMTTATATTTPQIIDLIG